MDVLGYDVIVPAVIGKKTKFSVSVLAFFLKFSLYNILLSHDQIFEHIITTELYDNRANKALGKASKWNTIFLSLLQVVQNWNCP